MPSRRQRRSITEKKKKKQKRRNKARAATIRKKIIVKMEPTAVAQRKSSAGATGCRNRRQDTAASEAANERRRQDKRTTCCGVCGAARFHNDYFCPYNYVHGRFGASTCREGCLPGRHQGLLLTASSSTGSGGTHRHQQLRRLVRVTNVPLSAIPGDRELCWLFSRFGPPIKCNLTRVSLDDSVGFGWITFESREHAEEAINKLNVYLVGDRKLRVDWVYPGA